MGGQAGFSGTYNTRYQDCGTLEVTLAIENIIKAGQADGYFLSG
jgi:hypothetical protein